MDVKRELLQTTLALAVPLWQQKIAKNYDYYFEMRDELVTALGSEGDSILYRSDNTAQNFNKLACAIALMSFQPNGIEVFDSKFQGKLK